MSLRSQSSGASDTNLSEYPDSRESFGKTHNDISGLSEYFGKANIDVRPNVSITAETLANAFNGYNSIISTLLHFHFVNGKGWWFDFAPLERRAMTSTVVTNTFSKGAMEITPEDVPPLFIRHKTESRQEFLCRYSNGAEFRMDFFKTQEGAKVFINTIKVLASYAWAACKIQVLDAITKSKQYYAEQNRVNGPIYTSLSSAFSNEIMFFGAIGKMTKAVYKLHQQVREIMKTENKEPTAIVFPSGTLSILAQDSFETEAFRRGPQAEKALTSGGRAMEGILAGVTIYEDEDWKFSNMNPSTISQLISNTTIGHWWIIEGSNVYELQNNTNINKMLSIQIPSMDGDKWSELKIKELIVASLRYDDLGNLHPDHEELLSELGPFLQRIGINPFQNLIDPYFFKSDAPETLNARSQHGRKVVLNANSLGFSTIKQWGDADPRYFPLDDNISHAKMFIKHCRQSGILSDRDISNIKELKIISKSLNEIDDITDPSIQAYFFAISANPENSSQIGNTDSHRPFLKINNHGSVMPPHIEINASGQRVLFVHEKGSTRKLYITKDSAGLSLSSLSDIRSANSTTADSVRYTIAPLKPYGYGNITGFNTLSHLSNSADGGRGWDTNLLTKIANGVESLNNLFRAIQRVYAEPSNIFFDSE